MFRRTGRTARDAAVVEEPLTAGTMAPSLSLMASTGEKVSLSDFRGRPVVLVFFPAAWSPVCGDQLALYNEITSLFEGFHAQVLALSVDGAWCQKAFADDRNLGFPLLADFQPKGAVAKAYGVYDAERGVSRRALFVINARGVIHWSYVSPSDVNPGADGILNALESI